MYHLQRALHRFWSDVPRGAGGKREWGLCGGSRFITLTRVSQ